MEIINESSSVSSHDSFYHYITYFDSEQKNELMNMIQYALFIIIPVMLLNKGIEELIAPGIDHKTTFEISLELVSEIVLLMIGMFFIHRLVSYIPTYSEKPYSSFSLIGFVFSFVTVLLHTESNIKTKVNHVYEKVYEYISGNIVRLESNPEKQSDQIPLSSKQSQQTVQTQATKLPSSQTQQVQTNPNYINTHAIQHMNPTANTSVSDTTTTYNQSFNDNLYQYPQQYPDMSNTETFVPFNGF